MIKLIKIFSLGIAFSTLAKSLPVYPQNTQEQVAPIAPSVLAEIRKAPFSQLFTVEDFDGDRAYVIKDRDFKGSNSDFNVITLWGDVPDRDIFQVIIRYCLNNRDLAGEQASLTQLIIADGEEILLDLTNPVAATRANFRQLSSSQVFVRSRNDPFGDPFMNPFQFHGTTTMATYVPPVECSFGGSRFDLSEVREAIANLPDKTLDLRLFFSNGVVETWRLGRGTVQQLQQLPTILHRQDSAP
ncbi:hypothetical protein [Gloeocapsa sp. PCC 73106]|uniref:hypothetical protein n=1 Tax=Gloeocapsa sp. PCC 73106 TaxID=102232 RepID=UPI0002ACA491|nr:hypothetical protein [Gloeocapsa sp. PCC 73106]ELR98280.1 hypothetical protein GLO73106DRAFT_00021070 [Gloeocapsa sp. PCC 73106]